MWEIIITIMIVGAAVCFAGYSIIRSISSKNSGGCGNGCSGCSCASINKANTNKN